MKLLYLVLFNQLFFTSCTEKQPHVKKVDFRTFVESSNSLLKMNTYFGVLDTKLAIPLKDTAVLLMQPDKKSVNYAYSTFDILFDNTKTTLNIEFYGNLNSKEIDFLKENFMIENKLEGVSYIVKMNDLFCKIWLSEELKSSSVMYLQNVKITLLENYIKLLPNVTE